jgi:sugar lactone lactonase YvrE
VLGTVAPVIGSAPAAYASDPLTFDHLAGRPRHQTPEDVAVDGAGNVYVVDSGGYMNTVVGDRVTKYAPDGTFLDVLAGPDVTSPGTAGLVANPSSVAVAPNGNVYVLENGNGAAGYTTNEVSYYDGLGNVLGHFGVYGPGLTEFKDPQGIAVDSLGNVFVADHGNDRIQGFTASGVAFVTWSSNNVMDVAVDPSDDVWAIGGGNVTEYSSVDGSVLGTWPSMSGEGIDVASDGTVWVSQASSVSHYTASKTLLGTISGFSTAEGIDVTDGGTLYVADSVAANVQSGTVYSYVTPSLETSWSAASVKGVAVSGSTVAAAGGGQVATSDTSGNGGTSWASAGAYGVAPGGAGDYWVSSTADNVVREYDGSGNVLTTIGAADLSSPKGVAYAGGKVFVADAGNNRIVRYATDGTLEASWTVNGVFDVAVNGGTVYATDGSNVRTSTTSGTSPSSWVSAGSRGVAVDGSGNVWVSSTAGLVRSYTSGGTYRYSVGWGRLVDPFGIAIGGTKLYVADNGADRVKRFSTVTSQQYQWGTYPGPGVEDLPTGVATDATGNVYVTNKSQDVVQKYDANGVYLQDIGTGFGSDLGKLQNPGAVAYSPFNDLLYVADTTNNRVERFQTDGTPVDWWGGGGTQPGTFNDPAGVAIDPATGNVFVSDTGNNRIQKFTPAGVPITMWGSNGTSSNQFRSPHGLTVAGGYLWIADTTNDRIAKYSLAGVLQTTWSSSGTGDGLLKAPYDVALDGEGTVWVADRTNNRIQRFSTSGAYLSKLGSTGLDSGQFDAPSGIEIDATGRVLVADTNNHRVQVFIDNNGPDVTFTGGPGTATKSSSATFQFTANEPNATFECKLDAAVGWTNCTSGVTYSALAETSHTLAVRATDALGHLGNPTSYTWAVDVTPPTASVTNAPSSPSPSTSPSFSFNSSEPNSTFKCSLDGAAKSTCASPKSVTVTGGSHTFKVWAIDAAGNESTTPAVHTWTVDTTPPTVTIDAAPPAWSVTTDATFKFSSSTDADATFECRLDSASYAPCTSPQSFSSLVEGSHTFYVRAIDSLGNISPDKTKTWTVDLSDHQPDGWISTGKTYIGDGVYNTTGTNQTKTLKKSAKQTAIFTLRFENDGTSKDVYAIKGPASIKGYTVSYWIGTVPYTSQVTAGTLTMTLSPGQYKILTLRVTVGTTGHDSASFVVKATSQHDPTKADAVKAAVKRV